MEARILSSVLAARARLAPDAGDSELLSLRNGHPGLVVQLLTLERLPSGRALAMIGHQTLRAAKRGGLLATKPEVDLLLRIAGTSQIDVAIKNAGYRARGEKLLVAVGPAAALGRLRRELVKDRRYELLEDRGMNDSDRAMVERAALLGTRP
jgi:hypothetical protein